MSDDHLRYDLLVQDALRGMVRGVLAEVAQAKSLPGDHHFFITFETGAEGVRLSSRLRAQYPEEMTIVLQHQFWDLKVTDESFEVGLSFGGVAEKLAVPFDAIKVFADPSVQFTLQFDSLIEGEEEDASGGDVGQQKEPEGRRQTKRRDSLPAAAPETAVAEPKPDSKQASEETNEDKSSESAGAEVVRLDRFRKK
jgi:hypothetical protein